MRQQRAEWLYIFALPFAALAQVNYDVHPVGRPPIRSGSLSRGYQLPPQLMLLERPRSRFNSYQPQVYEVAFRNDYERYQNAPHINSRFEESSRPNQRRRQDFLGSQIASHHEIRPPLVQPQPNDFPRFTAQSPPDVLNNIIVHIYLNAKDKHSHTVATSPLIKGVFGIGTAHGGLGTHTDPIVITKDFDRDTLEFVEEDKAKDMIEEGPANIVEVKATVSSPNRKIENTVNKAVSTELERAIPAVINRLQGPMSTMDSELRKELEQALVEELAKNLGNTIDQMETKISDEDLGRLIEEGLTEIDKEFTTMASVQPSTIRRTAVSTTMTTTESTTHPKTTPPSTITRRTTMADVDEFLSESPFEKTSPALPIKTTLTPKTSTLRTSQVVTSTRAITSTATTSARPRTRQWWETSTRPIAETTSTFASHSITTPTTTTTTPTRSHPIWTARRTTITRTEPTTTATQPTTRFSSETQAAGVSPNTTAWTTHRQTTSTTSTRISSATRKTWATRETTTHALSTATHALSSTSATSFLTTRAYFTTASSLDRWKTMNHMLKHPALPQVMITDIGAVLDEETEHVASEPAQRITTRPSPEGRKPTRWRGSVEETSIIESDLEPNIVTSRPINIINLEEDADTTTSRRGITTSARITISPRPTTIELPHAAITDGAEFGFETENTLPSINFKFVSLGQNRTTAAVSTTLSASYSSTEGASYTMPSSTIPTLSEVPEEKGEKEEDEEEEEEEKEGKKSTQVVTKIRPTNFGDENMIRARIEPEMLQQQITTLPEERDMNEVTSILPAITTATQATSIGPNIAISEVTSSTSLSTSESNLPPFEAIPGVFEEQRMTFAQEEFSTASEGARKMITTASFLREEEQLPPDTFIKPKGQCPTPNDDSDRNRTDVLFLLDSSNSFNEHKFMHAIQLILDTVSHFGNIGPDGTQVSLVQYNSEPYLEFSLRKHNCKQSLIDDIADTDYMQGSGNMLGKAVEKVARFAFTKNRGDRPDAENVLVVLTNGQSEDRVQEPVEVAKKNNLTVLVIATLEANPSYLVELAGNMDNVFQLHTEPNKSLSRKLADRINSVAAETAELDAIRVVDDHSVLTIALPIDEEMEQPEEKQEKEEERKTEAKENVGKTGLETGTSAITAVPLYPTVFSTETETQRMVELECSHLEFKIKINPPAGYEGVAVVKGQEDKEGCKKEIHSPNDAGSYSVDFVVATNDCGIIRVPSVTPAGHNYSLILHLKHHDSLRTSDDRAYLLQCFIGKQLDSSELTADLNIMKGELMIAETISLSSVPPTCAYSIRRDSPDGAIIHNAFVGQTVYHRWECDGGEEANKVYGIQIHNCHASDDVDEKFPIVDSKGCSTDLSLLSDPKYDDNRLAAYSESKAFAFEGADLLKFVCKLSLCTRDEDGCEGVTPPTCDDSNTSDLLVTRRFRHYSTAMEGALSSALSTKVGMAMNRPSTLQDRVHNLLSTKAASSVIAIVLLIAIIATVALLRYLRESENDTTTTYSDSQRRASSSPSSILPLTDVVDAQPTTSMVSFASPLYEPPPAQSQTSSSMTESSPEQASRRLAEFMIDFDRSKYV